MSREERNQIPGKKPETKFRRDQKFSKKTRVLIFGRVLHVT
jgi:hypothetical protein